MDEGKSFMSIYACYFNNNACFSKNWSGFDAFKLITVIVGRNNSGKSSLLELVEALCKDTTPRPFALRFAKTLLEEELRQIFRENVRDVDLVGDPWRSHGQKLVGASIFWTLPMGHGAPAEVTLQPVGEALNKNLLERYVDKLVSGRVLINSRSPLSGKMFRHLMADRDIRPEVESINDDLAPNGANATNLIKRCITSQHLPRDLIRKDLLLALNEIFRGDGNFLSLTALQSDEMDRPWEVFLEEEHKRFVSLSRSGSGLKTVILVLLNLIVLPRLARPEKGCVFAFEELENNLHPALLRRLTAFIERFSRENQWPVFLTTHSPVLIDMLGSAEDAQIVQVAHDGRSASVRVVQAHLDKISVIASLGSAF